MTPCLRTLLILALGALTADHSSAQTSRDEIARDIEPVLANPYATGLLVFDVEPKSQAEKAGLRRGDILTHYDAQPVSTTTELTELRGLPRRRSDSRSRFSCSAAKKNLMRIWIRRRSAFVSSRCAGRAARALAAF